ncbi:MAG: hypothetical protein L0Z73_09135 [Gammaproteobacteria bacterium]|nr:hypothetical protein [Gammaproteobacteria bacterium]
MALQWYQKGKQAFSRKQYSEAIDAFKKAFDHGYDEARLHHAWGAALYQTRQYNEAQQHFLKALKDPAFTQLANLNLGLVALQQNQNDQAISWFLKARDNGDSHKVRILAEEMLHRMNYSAEESLLPEATIVYISMKAGYEDQAYSIALDEVGASDQFLQFNLYASMRILGDEYKGVNANFNVFSLQNRESQDTEVSTMMMQLGYYKKQPLWRVNSNLGVTPSYLAGEPYTTAVSADLQLQYNLVRSMTLGGLLSYESVKAESAEVDYAAGQIVKSRVQLKQNTNRSTYYLTCQYEKHDLHDRTLGSNFYSYSPTRRSIQLQHRYQLRQAWSAITKLRYRRSEYADVNQIDGEIKPRVEDQIEAGFTLSYLLSRHATLLMGILHTDNRSTWEQYTYQRNEYTVGMEWLFL